MNKKIVYWDSNAFLGILNSDTEKEYLEACESVWESARQGNVMIVTSTFTITEVIYVKGKPKLDPSKRELVNNFFLSKFIALRPLTREIAQIARDVVWDNSIKPKDAVHIATAGFHQIKDLHTLDRELINRTSLIIEGHSLNISKPQANYQLDGLKDISVI